ncbi:hypothetical protein CSKR_100224 [Clonorchis sinensis]|uniref:Uncharacterized protein n=1 Tax=Clonorchis sinensis TaxID=79923 RepID=A0A8T1LYK0_CLOSI|nr:hypothetical protein CSKR_100224 [Clonorchis sinensis]
MRTFFLFITIGLLKSAMTRSIPKYDLCMEACGESPFDDLVELTKVEACRDTCNEEEKIRCIAKHQNNEQQKLKCWKDALDRCIVRCGDDGNCLEMCREFHTPE